nr:SpoIIE family protein phosphatase [Bacteroidales bacterium]
RLYSRIGYITDNPDTTLKYSKLSLQYCEETDYHRIADNNAYLSWAYYIKDEEKLSLQYSFKAVKLYENTGDMRSVGINYVAIAQRYLTLNNRDSIFYYFNNALKIFEEEKDTANIIYTYVSIANAYFDWEFIETANENLMKALHLATLQNDSIRMADAYHMLGYHEPDPKKGIAYLKKSISLFDAIKPNDDPYFTINKYNALQYLAQAYISLANKTSNQMYADSCYYYLKKVGTRELDFGEYENYIMTQICYASYLSFCNKYNEAIQTLLSCQQYTNEEECDKKILTMYYDVLTNTYKKMGNYQKAMEASDQYHKYKSEYNNDSTLNVLANFKTEQAMKTQIAEQNAEKRRHRTIILALTSGLLLVSLLVFIILKALRDKQKANKELTEKNMMISTQKEIITEQWHEVEDVNKKLLSSINYAKRIQTAVLPSKTTIDAIFPENFVFYRPRDIVSGDFYYATECGRYKMLITADCTGHGIPGALLSMLGISALKDSVITEAEALKPGIILDRMRIFIKEALGSNKQKKSLDDGMDMTICSYDMEAMTMYYATANQSAFIVRNGIAIRLKGDKMPVGRYVVEQEHFQSLTQPIEKGDMIYTFSDGIPDQPGGMDNNTSGRKFLAKNLKEFLVENYTKPLDEQCTLLEERITQWRNGRPQVDDMTLIGIKI